MMKNKIKNSNITKKTMFNSYNACRTKTNKVGWISFISLFVFLLVFAGTIASSTKVQENGILSKAEVVEIEKNTIATINTKLTGTGEYSYYNPIIPKGFKTVDTTYINPETNTVVTANWNVINREIDLTQEGTEKVVEGWNEGLVIEDENGNQFVWVPVKDGVGLDGAYDSGDTTTVKYKRWVPKMELYGGYSYQDLYDDNEGAIPVNNQSAQVDFYGGFYIARYEAGLPDDYDRNPDYNQTQYTVSATTNNYTTYSDNTTIVKAVSKKGAQPWNYINYDNSNIVAQAMVNTSNEDFTDGAKTGLVTGTMWDTTMRWLKINGYDIDSKNLKKWGNYYDLSYEADLTNGYVRWSTNVNSSSQEWTKDTVTKSKSQLTILYTSTGANTKGISKNIYDIGGNMYEWTTERYINNSYILRGGLADTHSTYLPQASRICSNKDNCSKASGFRTCLYVALPIAQYTVEHYKQNTDGTYPTVASETENLAGTIYTDVTATPKTYQGYEEDTENANRVVTGNISEDGSLELKIYYKLQLGVIYKPGTKGTFDEQSSTVDFGVTTPAFIGETTGTAGYTFGGWNPEVAETVTENAEYVATWTANTDTAYKVEHYKQNADGTYPTAASETENLSGTTDTVANAVVKTTYEGFVEDTDNANRVVKGNIAGDGSLVLKVYYKLQLGVTYKPGTKGTFDEQSSTVDFGATTPAFTVETTGAAGYTFGGWKPEVAETVTENAEYIAQWTANTNTAYKVEHYKQNADETYPAAASETENLTGTTDTAANAVIKTTYEGFIEDTDNANRVVTGNIKGDGSLVLKVYYKHEEQEDLYLQTQTYTIGENNQYEDGDQYIHQIEENTTVETFIQNLSTNGELKVYNQDGQELSTNDLIGTGMTIKSTKDDQIISVKIGVKADIDGNGSVTVTDLSMLNQHMVELIELKGIYSKVVDFDNNNKLTITDLSEINKYIVGKE